MAQDLTPLIIINEFLLAGMKTVGERFASGEMQLPFVLGSAETMKAAVAYLEPFMEKADQGGKGTMVLATVKGDVHDIGKNLVDIILTNNGYTVRNLGHQDRHRRDGGRRRGVRCRRHRDERAPGEVHADHAREPGGAQPPRAVPHPGDPGRRGADPHLCGARPPPGLRRAPLLRQGRLRGAAHHGPPRRDPQVGRGRPRPSAPSSADATSAPARASCASRPPRRPAPAASSCRPGHPGWRTTTRCSRRPSSAAGWPRGWPSTTSPPTSTRPRSSATSGASGRSRARTTPPSRTGSGRSCVRSWPRPRPSSCSSPRSPGGTSPPTPTATTWSSGPTSRAPPSRCASPSPGRSRTPTSASPTSTAPSTPASRTSPASRW